MGDEFGADYVVTTALPAVALERIGPINPSYAIYRLPRGDQAKASAAAAKADEAGAISPAVKSP